MIKKNYLLFIMLIFISSITINIIFCEGNNVVNDDIANKINSYYIQILELEDMNVDNLMGKLNLVCDLNMKIKHIINNEGMNQALVYLNEVEALISQIDNEFITLKADALNINNIQSNQGFLNNIISIISTVTICYLFWIIFKIYYVGRIQNMKPVVVKS